jgi:predicted nucleic acid-binding protein
MTELDKALSGIKKIGIDTAIIIYFMESNPLYNNLIYNVFQRISNGSLLGITSIITLIEVLIHPIRQGNTKLQEQYTNLLLDSNNFYTISANSSIAKIAAQIRSCYDIRIPDAIQIATAKANGCEVFLTNDINLRRIGDLRVLILDDFRRSE